MVIETFSFHNCTELSSVTLPQNLEHTPRDCFSGCQALTRIPIPLSAHTIAYRAFATCRSLSSMDLPKSMDVIGKEAFHDCTVLTTVTIHTTASSDLQFGNIIFRIVPRYPPFGCIRGIGRNFCQRWTMIIPFYFKIFENTTIQSWKQQIDSIRRRRYIWRTIPDNQDMKTRFGPVLQEKQMEIEELNQQLEAMSMVRNRKQTGKWI